MYYKRLRDLTEVQVKIVDEYKWAWNLFGKSGHFSPDELNAMEKVYSGILEQSVKNVDGILSIVGSFKTQMSDAARLELIVAAADAMERNWQDLKRFTDFPWNIWKNWILPYWVPLINSIGKSWDQKPCVPFSFTIFGMKECILDIYPGMQHCTVWKLFERGIY